MYDSERRKFGQNFLVDHAVCKAIAEDADPVDGGTIIEIGPGAGAITEFLTAKGRVVAIEIDPKWAEKLPRKVPKGADLVVVNQDALHVDLEPYMVPGPSGILPVLCGNLPYNRATAILLRYMPDIRRFRHMTFMVQLEVAKRICAGPGGRDYGSLSVLVANHAVPEIRIRIGPDSFRPRPRVHSATFLLKAKPEPMVSDPMYPWFVRAAFRQKRKTLRNSLLMTFPANVVDGALAACELAPGIRGEQIAPEGFAQLFHAFLPHLDHLRQEALNAEGEQENDEV
ncbi:MAG: 16S rRNA (adenine(1518)-N(6)/adenine(1519)-N(6))-dimethyltransferase RsmA [Fibrobacterota bacterium]